MRPSSRLVAVLAFGVCLLPSLCAQTRDDFTQPQSAPRPAPKWLKWIDQGTNDPRLKGYFTPEGIKVEIVAEAPVVINPVGMTFGEDGTPYVIEWVPEREGAPHFPQHMEKLSYKDGSTREVATMKKSVNDVIKILRFNSEKKSYDRAEVVLQDELPSTVLLHDGWLYTASRGTVRRFKQSKPGGPYDVKQIIAQGFCGFHHHQVSGLTIGNDGWLYITSGDDDNVVEGSDGSRATVLRTGAVFRCRPDGSKMHVFAIGFRNPYRDVAFNESFNLFHVDNDNEDGSKFTGCRLMHIAEGNDFGWRLQSGARCCVPDHVRGAVFGELPGKVAPLLKTGRGAPAGLLIYNDTRFPEEYRGLLYYPDVFRKVIRAYAVKPKGASYEVAQEFAFLRSDDPLFRPCQMVLGPDGAMYVVDWRTDSGGAGRLWGDGKHGRIYRLTWAGTREHPALPPRAMDSWQKIVKLPEEELLKTLDSEEFSDRQKAQRELVRRGEKQRAGLLKVLADRDRGARARWAALGALESMWNAEVRKALLGCLRDADDDLRRLAIEALGLNAERSDKEVQAALLKLLNEPELPVRRAAYLAMGRLNGAGAADALVNTLSFLEEKDRDPVLHDGLVRAIEYTGKEGIERLLALAESGVQKELDRVVEAFTMMRTRPAAEAIPTLLENPHLSIAQRAGLIRSYGNYLLLPPLSLEPALAWLSKHPEEAQAVKLAGLEVLSLGQALKGEKAEKWLFVLLEENDPAVRLSVIRAIEQTRLTKAAPKLAKILGEKGASEKERLAAIQALRVLADRSAVPVLKEILAEDSPATQALRRDALRTLGALDLQAALLLAEQYLAGQDEGLQTEAVLLLGTQPAGAKRVGKLFLERKLPRTLLPQVSEALRKHAGKERELNGLLNAVMKTGLLVSTAPADLEKLRKLVQTKGSVQRGRELFLNSATLACIRCHRLESVGGQVGPDLTRVWETHSVEKLIESLVEPSKEIKEGYQTFVATTKKGQVYTGLKIAQSGDEVVLRDSEARDIRIASKDLDSLEASKQSLMPDNVVAQLSYDDFIHLVAFLKDRSAQESLRGLALEFYVVGPFGNALAASYPPEKKPDPTASYPGDKPGVVLRWQAAQSEPSGLLDLGKIYKREKISAYALTHVYSPTDQKVEMLVGSDDTVRIWLNDKLVHEYAQDRSARPDQDRVAVSLQAGWNRVLVKVVNGTTDHGLYLRFTGGNGLRVSRTPQEK